MSKLLQDAFNAAESLDERGQEEVARAVMRQVAALRDRAPADRRSQLERIRQLSPLHGRSEEFLRAAREFREDFRFKHDDEQ